MARKWQRYQQRLHKYLRISWRLSKLYYRSNPFLFILNGLFILYTALAPLAQSWIFKLIIDQIITDQRQGVINLLYLGKLLAVFLAIRLSHRLGWILLDYCERILYLDFSRLITLQVNRKFSRLDFSHWQNAKLHDLFNKVRESYTYRPINFAQRQFYLLQSAISLIANAVAIAIIGPLYIGLLLLAAIPEFWVNLKFSRSIWSIHGAKGPIRRNFWNTSYYLTREPFLAEIQALGLQKILLKHIDRLYQKFFGYQKKAINRMARRRGWATALNLTVRFILTALLIVRTALNKMTVGSLTFYSGRLRDFSNDLYSFFRNLAANFEDLLYISDFFQLLELPALVKEPRPGLKPKPPFQIELRDVSFHYPYSHRWVLRHFNLLIQPREKVALIGVNGAGKTTLIKLILRFYDPQEGQILVNGRDLREINLPYWRQQIGAILQDFNRYAYSLRRNVTLGDVSRPVSDRRLKEALRQAEAQSLWQRLPRREKTILSKEFRQGADLSTGEWQKVALARAFYRQAPILILDEPTAAIDASSEARIFARIQKIFQKRTVIMISHRFSTVRHADKIVVLDKGKIIEEGSHRQLMTKKGRYAKLFHLQAKGYRET